MKVVIRQFFPSVWAGCQAKKKMFIIVIIIMIILRYHFIEPRLALPLPVYLRANLISLTLPRECRDLDVHHHAWFCACAMLRIDPWLHAYWVSTLPAESLNHCFTSVHSSINYHLIIPNFSLIIERLMSLPPPPPWCIIFLGLERLVPSLTYFPYQDKKNAHKTGSENTFWQFFSSSPVQINGHRNIFKTGCGDSNL